MGVALFIFAMYLIFYPNWLHIRTVRIVGVRTALEQELRGQVERYLEQRTYFVPHKNILFLNESDLRSYILTVNPGVWRVDEVKKEWPHGLAVRVVPRDPTFTVVTQDGAWLISNDGLTLPEAQQNTNTLLVSAHGLKSPELGKVYLSGNLLAMLAAVKKNFAALTGLPQPIQVVLRPVVLDAQVAPVTHMVPVATDSITSTPIASSTPVVSELMPEEAEVVVPASESAVAFRVLLHAASTFDEVFRQLQVLIAKQGPERLQRLAYIDMRFAGKAFICLENTPCARSESIAESQLPGVNASAPKQ
jgi:hypothetical protein